MRKLCDIIQCYVIFIDIMCQIFCLKSGISSNLGIFFLPPGVQKPNILGLGLKDQTQHVCFMIKLHKTTVIKYIFEINKLDNFRARGNPK